MWQNSYSCFTHIEILTTTPLSSPKCANYKTYYSMHPKNKRDVHPKNLLYETCKKIYLPRNKYKKQSQIVQK